MIQDIQAQVAEPIQTVVQKLEGWLDSFISLIPNMAVTLLLLIIFFVLAKFGSKLFRKLFSKVSNNEALELADRIVKVPYTSYHPPSRLFFPFELNRGFYSSGAVKRRFLPKPKTVW